MKLTKADRERVLTAITAQHVEAKRALTYERDYSKHDERRADVVAWNVLKTQFERATHVEIS